MIQQEQPTVSYSVERGDELSLTQLLKVLLEYKLLIIVFTALTTLSAIYYVSTLPTIYKSGVLMIPAEGANSGGGSNLSAGLGGLADMAGIAIGGGNNFSSTEQSFARLKTRSFLINHIKEKSLKPILFANQWSKSEKEWIDKEPSDRDSAELLMGMIDAGSHPRSKAGLMSLTVIMKNPVNPNKIADIANELVSSMNFDAKQRAILEGKKSISFLEKELESTIVINAQAILYNLIEQQTAKIMMANVRDEFIFKVIDPAVIPKGPEVKPTLMYILIGVTLGIFLGSFFAVSVNYFKE